MSFRFDLDQLETFAKEKQKVVNTFLSLCVGDIGLMEEPNNRGKWVDALNKWIKAQLGSSYCVTWLHSKLQITTDLTGWQFGLFRSASCKETADKTPDYMKVKADEIAVGDIIIWKVKLGWQGHAAVVEEVLGDGMIQTIEANTSPSEDYIERNGGGVYRKKRPISGIGNLKLYAIIRPTSGMTKS